MHLVLTVPQASLPDESRLASYHPPQKTLRHDGLQNLSAPLSRRMMDMQQPSSLAQSVRASSGTGTITVTVITAFRRASCSLSMDLAIMTQTLTVVDLQACRDTYVGDGMTRGVSGGQKKRVTCGEPSFLACFVHIKGDLCRF